MMPSITDGLGRGWLGLFWVVRCADRRCLQVLYPSVSSISPHRGQVRRDTAPTTPICSCLLSLSAGSVSRLCYSISSHSLFLLGLTKSQHRSSSSPVSDGNQFQPSHRPNHPQSIPAQHRSNHGTPKWYVNFIITTISPIHIISYSLYTLPGLYPPKHPNGIPPLPTSMARHSSPRLAPAI